MRHLNREHESIQPWPTKRPHIAKVDGETTEIGPCSAVIHGGPGSQSSHPCDRLGPHTYHYSADYDLWWETDEGWANSGTNVIDEPIGDVPKMDPIIPDDEPVFILRAKDYRLLQGFASNWLNSQDNIDEIMDWVDVMEAYVADHETRGNG